MQIDVEYCSSQGMCVRLCPLIFHEISALQNKPFRSVASKPCQVKLASQTIMMLTVKRKHLR